MNDKTIGAWVIHHSQKLRAVELTPDYEQISFAGKRGSVLNAFTGSEDSSITNDKMNALSQANGIHTRLELPAILNELERQRLIDKGEHGIEVLGLTSGQVLEKTAAILEEVSPKACERAAIDLSEQTSDLPMKKEHAAEYISDAYEISSQETEDILRQYEEIGFFDFEDLSEGEEKIYFNGNLFRHGEMAKANAVISSLSSADQKKVQHLLTRLTAVGCLARADAMAIAGDTLYSKLCAIGFVDENSIGNERGSFVFVTRPAAFSKFSLSVVDDAFDLAKAFVTSLTYGITTSPDSRGRIRMIEALLGKLIAGKSVGPATAIGHDYKVLEMKGVLKVSPAGHGMFTMRLLKREVGELALAVITEGEASTESLLHLPSVSATTYQGPEANRIMQRKRQSPPLKKSVANLLRDIRTGGIR
ncbi:MAG: hypothetical protein JMDDDDMK_04517 [Acidobacteria bacterium]|nr:hypothetical protein [Acidobacteriota bacterium]